MLQMAVFPRYNNLALHSVDFFFFGGGDYNIFNIGRPLFLDNISEGKIGLGFQSTFEPVL